jgi:uncharacterized membrane protein
MRWIKNITRPGFSYGVSAILLIVLSPFAAAYAEGILQKADPAAVPLLTYIWVLIFSLIGWAAASLSVLAGWTGGTTEERLEILQGIVASVAAGLAAFLLAKAGGINDFLGYILVMSAGFGGERALRKYFDRAKDHGVG